MKDRLLTLVLALAAFAVFYALLVPKPPPPQSSVTRPTSIERGPNGYYALERWLSAAQYDVMSLRERYNRLEAFDPATAGRGNLLITTMPHLHPLRPTELQPLRAWIARGNTVLVVAGLSDTPDWSTGEGADPAFMQAMEQLTGLTFSQPRGTETAAVENDVASDDKKTPANQPANQPASQQDPSSADTIRALTEKYSEPKRFELRPNGSHPLLAGVKAATAISEYPSGKWFAGVVPERLVLELAHDPESKAPVLWLLRYGDGQMIVSAYGSLFTNKALGANDNAQLLANIAQWAIGPGGRILIDDAHQGLVSFYDPDAFFGDSRLHATLWSLIALWLVFVLGPRRLRTPTSRWTPLDVKSFVRATGGFLARVVRPAEVAQRLFDNFFSDLHRQGSQPADSPPPWEWLASQSVVPAADVAKLRSLYERAERGRRIDLPALQTLLAHTRANLRRL